MTKLDDTEITKIQAELDATGPKLGEWVGSNRVTCTAMDASDPRKAWVFFEVSSTRKPACCPLTTWLQCRKTGSNPSGRFLMSGNLHENTFLPAGDLVGKRFRHFKGGLYDVIAWGSDTSEIRGMVAYRGVETGFRWCRTTEDWERLALGDCQADRRFVEVDPTTKPVPVKAPDDGPAYRYAIGDKVRTSGYKDKVTGRVVDRMVFEGRQYYQVKFPDGWGWPTGWIEPFNLDLDPDSPSPEDFSFKFAVGDKVKLYFGQTLIRNTIMTRNVIDGRAAYICEGDGLECGPYREDSLEADTDTPEPATDPATAEPPTPLAIPWNPEPGSRWTRHDKVEVEVVCLSIALDVRNDHKGRETIVVFKLASNGKIKHASLAAWNENVQMAHGDGHRSVRRFTPAT